MTALHRDLSAPEIWQRSFERSRHRRATAPKLRRQVLRRRRASTAMAAAMLAGPAAQFASAQSPSEGSGSGSDSAQTGIASESPANRAIAGEGQSSVQSQAMLQVGSAGGAVAAVQGELGIAADGVFDAETDRSVRNFQAGAGLVVDGIVGPLTWGALFGSGGGTGPAADVERPNIQIDPAVAADDRTPVGDRTRFAVRMASPDELSADELEKLGVTESSPASEEDRDGGLVAIQFRAPEAEAEAEDEPEPSRDAGHSHASSVEASTDAPEPDRSAGADAGDSGADTGSQGGANSERSEAREPEPREESKPRDRGDDKGSGSCSRRLVDPLGGKGTFTSGYRTSSRPSHAGIDLAAPSGTPIRAAACGVVNHISSNNGYGNFICIRHSSSLTTCYAHLSRFSDEGMGDRVRQGAIIGYVGSTGHSTGPHLHFETRSGAPYGGEPMDPRPYLDGREYSGTQAGATGGPDLQEGESPPRQASTAQAASSTEERSAVANATDREEEPARATSSERRASAGRSAAAEPEPTEPVEPKPASRTGEPGAEAEVEDKPAEEKPDSEPAAEENAAAPAKDGSAEADPQVAEKEEAPPVEEPTSEEPSPQGEVDVASEGAESSAATSAPASSNGSDPTGGEDAEQPSAGGDEATSRGDSSESNSGSGGSDGDAGSPASGGDSSSVDGTATATVEASASTATTGSDTANGSASAESATATAPGESAASSPDGSGATASEGSEASPATDERDSSAPASDASTEAYFSEEESDDGEPGAGD